MQNSNKYSVFEYLYRDAGNWKAWGSLLLVGTPTTCERETILRKFESGEFFVAEQLNIPSLSERLLAHFGGANDDDHSWHEFVEIRPATISDIESSEPWGSVKQLVRGIKNIDEWRPVIHIG